MDKLGVFHANQTSLGLDPHMNEGHPIKNETFFIV